MTNASAPTTPLPRVKVWLFRVVVLVLPVVALLLPEGVLRLAGFGGYATTFKRVGPTPHGELVITDQAGAITWFFANRERPGYNDQYHFYQPKPSNTVRVFVVGESAIKGFPQPRNLAATAFLRAMLSDAWPERTAEVINLGTTAVASYPVLGMMTEALDYEPDLVVIYTGHNEFFGTYGVASVGWAGGKPWRLAVTRWVHSLALVQAWAKVAGDKGPEGNLTLMERMVGRAYLAPDDWRRAAAANNLFANVREMIVRCQARGVPVLVCTQPSNERDLAPIGLDKLEGLMESEQREFEQHYEQGHRLLATDPAAAVEAFRAALAIQTNHARAHFEFARALIAQQHGPQAHAAFQRARDLDPMPWRAPGAANDAIRRAAEELSAPVCDIEAAFHRMSPPGGIGWELMDDHVHPTLRGQALIAESIIEGLTQFTGSVAVTGAARGRLRDWESYARQLGDNRYDRYAVAHMMRVVFDVPFMRETNPNAFDRFNTIANALEQAEPAEIQEVMRDYQTFRPHAGAKRPVAGMVARVLLRQKRYAQAFELYDIAQRGVPEYTSWHLEYVYFTLVCREKLNGRLSEEDRATGLAAIRQGEVLLRQGFSETGFTERHIGRLHQLRGEFAAAIPFLQASRRKLTGTDLVAADQALVVSYAQTGQFDQARELVAYGAAHAGQYAGMYEAMLNELPDLEKALRAGQPTTNPVSPP